MNDPAAAIDLASPPPFPRWFLTGPTAAGKTAVSIELARLISAEIVSMDSMALYRGMDIGTAKPTPAERAEIPHHLLDVLDPGEEFSLAQYVAAANAAAAEIHARGKQVLFVGGTPLYLKALLRGMFAGPPADWPLRSALKEQAARDGVESVHARLARVDPAAADRLHPSDLRRVIRAIEVFEKTGRPISQWQQQFDRPADPKKNKNLVFLLNWPRAVLHKRIDERVLQMFEAGFVEEVRRLAARGPVSRTARQAVGYCEVLEHLEGKRDLAETIRRVQQRTRQFAKRQTTWFRSLAECRAIEVQEPVEPVDVARRIAQTGREAISA
ncbi:MAG: tRNA (adenosine(37)-N6)-dimethylallyltransferase MiaA [Planctomycetia bacterium]|nr:tRNA (adenosine(37)-N6)-dimethylallyltransferase MiaA [Planctomycetia bacterium]